MGLGPGCRHVVTPEPLAHGWRRESPRRNRRLRAVASPGRSDRVLPPMEETPEGPGDEEAHEGGTGGLGDARMEANCRRNGTRLPGLATTPEDEVIARLRDHDSISPA